jgi:hypothetical protein
MYQIKRTYQRIIKNLSKNNQELINNHIYHTIQQSLIHLDIIS